MQLLSTAGRMTAAVKWMRRSKDPPTEGASGGGGQKLVQEDWSKLFSGQKAATAATLQHMQCLHADI